MLTPALAVAQDSVHVAMGGVEYPAYVAPWTPSFDPDEEFGPYPVVITEPDIACQEVEGGFEPVINNPEEVEGNIAFVARGACPFVMKVEAAAAAGAVAVIIWNATDEDNPDVTTPLGGAWTEGTSIPFVAVSWNTGQALLAGIKFEEEATIIPIRIAPVPTAGILDTGVSESAIYDNGFIGVSPAYLGAPGFTFNDDNGLYIASLLIGRDGAVSGDPYGESEFTTVDEVNAISPPFPAPYADFTQGYTTTYTSDIGVRVTANAYARAGDPFIVFDFELENTTGETLDEVFAGIFSDLDVGDAAVNLGGFDSENSLVYVYDESGTSTNYFGMVALSDNLSGWTLATDAGATEGSLWETMTTTGDEDLDAQDLRPVIGIGPFDLTSESVNARFALVAGEDEADIIANAADVRDVVLSVEETTPQGTYVLDAAYPNPFASRATIGFELPVAQDVTLTVYDVLGREVATLVNGMAPAGPQTVEFDAANLPSGVYLYRLEAGSTQLIQRVTLVR